MEITRFTNPIRFPRWDNPSRPVLLSLPGTEAGGGQVRSAT